MLRPSHPMPRFNFFKPFNLHKTPDSQTQKLESSIDRHPRTPRKHTKGENEKVRRKVSFPLISLFLEVFPCTENRIQASQMLGQWIQTLNPLKVTSPGTLSRQFIERQQICTNCPWPFLILLLPRIIAIRFVTNICQVNGLAESILNSDPSSMLTHMAIEVQG